MTDPRARAAPLVDCPICGTPSPCEPANAWRPFCSERCKLTDFGRWSSDAYRLAGEPIEEEPPSEDAPPS